MNPNKIALMLGGTMLVAVSSARSAIIITYGSPGAMSSTVPDAPVEDFNNPTLLGKDSNLSWSGVGTINSVYIRTADMYGGANNSDYAVQSMWVGEPNEVPNSTLVLNSSSAYFGLWWSAGDANNVMSFYQGNVLEAQFTTAQVMADLPSSYNGNPNVQFKKLDYHEDFAYLNFYGSAGTSWNKIVFSNLGTSGFESDNWTSRVAPWGQDPNDVGSYPGTQVQQIEVTSVPEVPVTGLFMGLGCLAIAGWSCRRGKSAPAIADQAAHV